MTTVQYSHLYGEDRSGGLWGIAAVSFIPTGALLSSTSEMEIGVEPVHRGRALEANINQPGDLVSRYFQEYRARASMATAQSKWTGST